MKLGRVLLTADISRRRARWWLVALLLTTVTAACGSPGPAEADFVIEGPTNVAPSSNHQYRTDGETPVVWGIQSSTAPTPTTAGSTAVHSRYPLRVSPDHRYLVDQQGDPWRIQADAGWLMTSEGTEESVGQYLDGRSAQGFNSFYLMAMVHPGGYEWAPHAPNNISGDPPFATPGDFSTAGATPESERYWRWVDWIVDAAAERDMVVMLAYTYLGFDGGNQGWWAEVNQQPSREALHRWGEWLGNRYKDRPNLIWFGLGDFTPPAGSEGAARVRAIADGIKASGATQLFMAEPSSPDSLPSDSPEFADVLDMYSFYGYGPEGAGAVYVTADRAWLSNPTRPSWMQEGTYEYDNYSGKFSGESWDARRGRFWSVLAGGTAGEGWGSRDAWHFENIPQSLDTPGATASTAAFQLFASMQWWTLLPSGADPTKAGTELVLDGGGQWGELDYVTAAVTAGREWLLAYVPVTKSGPRTITVDMSALSGPARARWWDPATGNYLSIAGADRLTNTGTHAFTTPGKRDDDTDDWLLVLDTSGPSPCGSITSDGMYAAPSVPPPTACEITATADGRPSVVARAPVAFTG